MDKAKSVAIIVAHPDDETLWAGGAILSNPGWECFVACLCRKNDTDRAPKFAQGLQIMGATGKMGDMDDGPEQAPIPGTEVEKNIMDLLPGNHFDLVITHSIYGEYTRHLRHEEIGRAVISLWDSGKLITDELLMFAYEDGHRSHHPVIIKDAPVRYQLPRGVWEKKYNIVTNVYGFNLNSWEAITTPKEEAFWQFFNVAQAYQWMADKQTS